MIASVSVAARDRRHGSAGAAKQMGRRDEAVVGEWMVSGRSQVKHDRVDGSEWSDRSESSESESSESDRSRIGSWISRMDRWIGVGMVDEWSVDRWIGGSESVDLSGSRMNDRWRRGRSQVKMK